MLVSQVLAEPMLRSRSNRIPQMPLRPHGLRIEGFNPAIPAWIGQLQVTRQTRSAERLLSLRTPRRFAMRTNGRGDFGKRTRKLGFCRLLLMHAGTLVAFSRIRLRVSFHLLPFSAQDP